LKCPACESSELDVFSERFGVPALCNVLCSARDEALNVPRGDVRLGVCPACGMMYNVAFDAGLIGYDAAYENSLHHSPSFADYAEQLARGLTDRLDLAGRTIVEIGCGDARLLTRLCVLSGARGVGFDPAADAQSIERLASQRDVEVQICPTAFDAAQVPDDAGLILCRHVLEHIDRPWTFLRAAAEAAERSGAHVFFEVPNAMFTIRDLGIWDIIYEHCSYFTAPALRRLFARAGLAPIEVNEAYGGQFLTVHARCGDNEVSGEDATQDEVEKVLQLTPEFSRRERERLGSWRNRLASMRDAGRTAAIWGAGSKGVMFLNLAQEGSAPIRWAVDRNPRKQGRFVAGAGQRIISPEELRNSPPDAVIVMNPLYRDEVAAELRALDLEPELLEA